MHGLGPVGQARSLIGGSTVLKIDWTSFLPSQDDSQIFIYSLASHWQRSVFSVKGTNVTLRRFNREGKEDWFKQIARLVQADYKFTKIALKK